MVAIEINGDLRGIVCDWILEKLPKDKLLCNAVQQSMIDFNDEESYVKNKKTESSPMGIECFYALAHKFSRPIWIHNPDGTIYKNYTKFCGDPIHMVNDGKIYHILTI